jgi:hypothetical protein
MNTQTQMIFIGFLETCQKKCAHLLVANTITEAACQLRELTNSDEGKVITLRPRTQTERDWIALLIKAQKDEPTHYESLLSMVLDALLSNQTPTPPPKH